MTITVQPQVSKEERVRYPNPFKGDGIWLRGNLHTHTTVSDGDVEPEETAVRYREAGYDFLAITDHGRLTVVEDPPEGLLMIPGEEVNLGRSEAGSPFHLVALGIHREGSPETSPQDFVHEVSAEGGLIVLCHPYWSGLSINDLLDLEGYFALEVFNTTCHYSVGKGSSEVHWDELLARGRRVWGLAVDDAHFHSGPHRPLDAFGGWVMVRCRERSVGAILEALKEGTFYASCGPKFVDLEVEGRRVYVATSPVKSITFISENGRGSRWEVEGNTLKEAECEVPEGASYVRVVCTDPEGRSAWTNPIFFG